MLITDSQEGREVVYRASMNSQQLTVLGLCAVVCMRDATRRHTACHEYDVETGTCKNRDSEGSVRYEFTTAVRYWHSMSGRAVLV